MASGFGTFRSSTYVTSGSGRLLTTGVVSQTVNSSTRKVYIIVITLLTYYRTSGAWKPGTGETITRWNSGNYIRATVGSESYDNYIMEGTTRVYNKIGFRGLNSGTVSAGQYTVVGDGVFTNYELADSALTKEFTYNDNGDAITTTWASSINLNGTVCSVSGTVTTDSIAPLEKPTHLYGSVNGRAKEITKLYGSVGNQAKKIIKLYAGDSEGKARLIYEDNS